MKRLLLLTVLAICFGTVCKGHTAKGSVKTDKITSSILATEKEYSIYLPAGYETSDKNYPVLYLLHGAYGCHTDWVKTGNAQRITDHLTAEGMALPMIIVMPDASGELEDRTGDRMGYFNRPGWNYEDFFFKEFIPHVESKYRIKADKKTRAIAGLSMGGGGAMVYALHHPELFGSACPLSGLLGGVKASVSALRNKVFSESIAQNNAVQFVEAADTEKVESLKTVRWYIDCGDDDYLYEGNVRMYMAMREKEITLQYRMRNGGHNWEYWQSALPTVLTFISIGFAE